MTRVEAPPITDAATDAAAEGAAEGAAVAPRPTDRRTLQRDALATLLRLADSCVEIERELETTYGDIQRRTAREYSQAESMLKQRYDKLRDTVKQRRAAELAVEKQKHAKRIEELRGEHNATVTSLKEKHRKVRKKLQREMRDAQWLAESVRDADTNRAEEALEETQKKLAEIEKTQAEQTDEAADLAARYGRRMPQVEDAPTAPDLEASVDAVTADLDGLRRMSLPKLFVGATPFILGFFLLLIAAAVAQIVDVGLDNGIEPLLTTRPDPALMGGIVGGTFVVLVVLSVLLKKKSAANFDAAALKFVTDVSATKQAADEEHRAAAADRDEQVRVAAAAYQTELKTLDEKFLPKLQGAEDKYHHDKSAAGKAAQARQKQLEQQHDAAAMDVNVRWDAKNGEIDKTHEGDLAPVRQKRDDILGESGSDYTTGRARLERDWAEALSITQTMAEESDAPEFAAIEDWRSWKPATSFHPTVRFGSLHIDLENCDEQMSLPKPKPYDIPALLAFPDGANLLLKHDPAGRSAAVDTLRLTMLRLLTSLPPGRVQFTLIDPVSLGESFAGFMHLADDDEALVGGRVWTDTDQIERQLSDLTEHMETVIQKYLRNAFETIDDYNKQAGELAEPYRFLVIADLPNNFSEAAMKRLGSIVTSGPRCGVHVLAALDVRQPPPGSATVLEDVTRGCTTLLYNADEAKFVWDDETFGRFPLTLDKPADDAALTDLLRVIGKAAREAKRVEVPFATITPDDADVWSKDSSADLAVPVGRTGATRLQQFRLGKGVAQHALIAGKTGSGKSTLLNGLICNLALHYGPDQLALYLIDFKRGVEFKTYATHRLPHARAIAVESDREFGLSVLQRLDEELARRGDLFREAAVQDLAAFRKAKPTVEMPRVLLVIDEFQELFSEDDKLSADAALLIDRLVRQGRAFGMHAVLGSQTIAGSAGLARSTLGQVAVRVALQCNEQDSRMILGEDNTAARLLTRPGEAIYNEQGGLVEANSPFQVAWLPDPQREALLKRVTAINNGDVSRELVVFEGNAPAKLEENYELQHAPVRQTVAYLGEAVAIKPPTHFPFRRQSGSHLLLVGQADESVAALVASSIISLRHTAPKSKFFVLDGTPTDAPLHKLLREVAANVDADAEFADYRALPDVLADVATEVEGRGAADAGDPLFLVIHGVQRFRDLSKADDYGGGGSFGGFLGGDEEDAPKAEPPGKLLMKILRDGPTVGVHVVASVDTYASLERRLGREALREFDGRVLFQMSANDSSVLIDSPAANRLGFYRALLCSEERGTQEKFRPYAVPSTVPSSVPSA